VRDKLVKKKEKQGIKRDCIRGCSVSGSVKNATDFADFCCCLFIIYL